MHGFYALKPGFQRALRPIEDRLVARRVHPDALTFTALGLSLIGGVAIALSPTQPLLLLSVPAVAGARLALNALDGLVARRLGLARPWGDVLNEVGDRLADLALLGGVLLVPGVNLPLGAAAIAAASLVSFIGVAGKAAGGRRQYGGPLGKADRMLLLAVAAPLALVFGAPVIFSVFLGGVLLGSIATAVHRLRTIRAELAWAEPASLSAAEEARRLRR